MYTIHEVVTLTGVNRYTLYRWRQLGLLPAPVGGRRFALYDDDYLRLVERIKSELIDARTTRLEYKERLDYERATRRPSG